jgi:DNA-binding LacI/PurR family transcriptional regulator
VFDRVIYQPKAGFIDMATARLIAKQLGISVSTVGRAMSDDPRISVETKAKVRKAAEKLGYVGSMPAKMIRGGKSNLIGLILPDVRNDFYAAIAQALSQACDLEGKRLVLSIAGDDRDAELRHIREFVGARVAGIIIVPSADPRRESVQLLRGVPYVQLLRHVPVLGKQWFGMNDESAMADATSYVMALGHRRIAYIGGQKSLSTGAARLRGFRNTLRKAGLSGTDILEELGEPTKEFGNQAIKRLLNTKQPPTALISGSVHITLGIIEAAEQLGDLVPEELSLVGFGDPDWFAWWRGGLTTISPPVQELALACSSAFFNQLRSATSPAAQPTYGPVVSSKLIVRATVKRLDDAIALVPKAVMT